jgi:hypothetical protein
MKKLSVLVAALFVMLLPYSVFGYVVYIEVAPSLQFSNIDGLQFDISGGGFSWSNSTSSLYLTTATVNVNGVDKTGAVTANWSKSNVSSPTTGFAAVDLYNNDTATPLVAGVLASVTAPNAFTASNFRLADSTQMNGKYPYAFTVSTITFTGGAEYVVSAVPIPAAVWLLGSGLLGLVAVRRRRKA